MPAKYQALDIANYILWYVNSNDSFPKNVSALKLQKLLYYVAAKYRSEKEVLLFDENIEKWKYGPVVPSVYRAFKDKGYGHINGTVLSCKINDDFSVTEEEFTPSIIASQDAEVIKNVLNNLMKFSAAQLVQDTHDESAWLQASNKILAGAMYLTYSEEDLLEAKYNRL